MSKAIPVPAGYQKKKTKFMGVYKLEPEGGYRPYQTDGLVDGTVLPEARSAKEGGGYSTGFNPQNSFAMFRDGQPVNTQAQELVEKGAVVSQMGQITKSENWNGATTNQKAAGAPQGAPQLLPSGDGVGIRPSVVAPQTMEETEQPKKGKGRRKAQVQATPAPSTVQPKPRPKATPQVAIQLPEMPATFPEEPEIEVEVSGSFGTIQFNCHDLIVSKGFIAIVHNSNWKGMRWMPPYNADEPDIFQVKADTYTWEAYYYGIYFEDRQTGRQYIILHLALG